MTHPRRSYRLVFVVAALAVAILLGGYAYYRFRELTGHLDQIVVQQVERQLGRAVEGVFVVEDWHNFGAYYDPTLMAWLGNFEAAWPALAAAHADKYDERFHRMWRYYLASFAGAFRARILQLWQVVLSPSGVPGGYISIR